MTDTQEIDIPKSARMLAVIVEFPENFVAWYELDKAGLTKEILEEAADSDSWQGPKPDFSKYPVAGVEHLRSKEASHG